MAKIHKTDVLIRRRYIVDCLVCQEAVEPESGSMDDRREAEAARDRHMREHELSGRKGSLVDDEINPYLRYNG